MHVYFCILSCHEFQKHISLSAGPKFISYKLKTGISRYYNKNRVLHNKWLNFAFLNVLETRKMKLPAKEILMFRARRPSPKQSERLPATSEKVCFKIFRKSGKQIWEKVKEFNHVVKGLGICRPCYSLIGSGWQWSFRHILICAPWCGLMFIHLDKDKKLSLALLGINISFSWCPLSVVDWHIWPNQKQLNVSSLQAKRGCQKVKTSATTTKTPL